MYSLRKKIKWNLFKFGIIFSYFRRNMVFYENLRIWDKKNPNLQKKVQFSVSFDTHTENNNKKWVKWKSIQRFGTFDTQMPYY